MNKNFIVYNHPIIGDITLNDIIEQLDFIIEYTRKFENITLDLLKNLNVDENTIISLYPLLTSSELEEIVDDLKYYLE